MPVRILLVDDDLPLCKTLTSVLRHAGYLTMAVGCAEEAFQILHRQQIEMILLDLGLPDMDGYECLRYIRKRSAVPVVLVTGRQRSVDEVIGLDLGADDFITKPFEMDVFLARLKAVLRRYHAAQPNEIVVGSLHIDLIARTVRLDDQEIMLPPKEFDLLKALAENAGQVFGAQELLARVWGEDWVGETQTIYVHMRWLREKLEPDPAHPQLLVTVSGVGYRLDTSALIPTASAI